MYDLFLVPPRFAHRPSLFAFRPLRESPCPLLYSHVLLFVLLDLLDVGHKVHVFRSDHLGLFPQFGTGPEDEEEREREVGSDECGCLRRCGVRVELRVGRWEPGVESLESMNLRRAEKDAEA